MQIEKEKERNPATQTSEDLRSHWIKSIICRRKISLNCKRITTKLKRMERSQHGISSIPFTLYYSLLLQ